MSLSEVQVVVDDFLLMRGNFMVIFCGELLTGRPLFLNKKHEYFNWDFVFESELLKKAK